MHLRNSFQGLRLLLRTEIKQSQNKKKGKTVASLVFHATFGYVLCFVTCAWALGRRHALVSVSFFTHIFFLFSSRFLFVMRSAIIKNAHCFLVRQRVGLRLAALPPYTIRFSRRKCTSLKWRPVRLLAFSFRLLILFFPLALHRAASHVVIFTCGMACVNLPAT